MPKATKRTASSASSSKRGRGQPSKYRPEFCERIVDLAKKGRTFQMIACEFGVHVDSLHEWAAKVPQFSEAKKLARQWQEVKFQQMFMKGMVGKLKRVATRTESAENGDVTTTYEYAPFAQAAAIFWAKAQFSYDEAGQLNDDDVEPIFD